MYFFEELNELKRIIIPCLIVFVCLAAFFFVFPFSVPFSAKLLTIMKQDLLSPTVKLITTNPLNAFLAQMMVSLFLALLAGLPFYLYKIIKYLAPALYEKERKAVFKALIPSTFLFLAGCVFAYFLLIPYSFDILYSFAAKVGAETFFAISDFVSSVLAFMIVSGTIFLLPVFMVLLSRLGLVEHVFWRKKWRIAILITLIFSAIITPDGTGITMMLLSLPVAGLYFLGCILS